MSYSDERVAAWVHGNAWLDMYVHSVGLFCVDEDDVGVVDKHRHCRSSVRRSGVVGCASVLVAPRRVVRRRVEGRIVVVGRKGCGIKIRCRIGSDGLECEADVKKRRCTRGAHTLIKSLPAEPTYDSRCIISPTT